MTCEQLDMSLKDKLQNKINKPKEEIPAQFRFLVDFAKNELRNEYEAKYQNFVNEILALPELKVNNQIIETFKKIAEASLTNLKGDKGDSPTEEELIPMIQNLLPEVENGQDYVLTKDDKKEIAGLVTVPIVKKIIEKRTVVEKQPITIDKTKTVFQVKEKAIADKPIVTARKLNTLNGKVNMSVIIGLEKAIERLYRAIKEKNVKGGGMGNIVHQSISVSSGTTTFVCSSKVAANGFAVWAYYEGALIVRDVGYTMGGDRKTCTLLFTPEDNTHIDLVFIRA